MKFKVYSEAEKAAWLRGRISMYYKNKSAKNNCNNSSKKNSSDSGNVRFTNYSASDALNAAFERTYGKNKS